MSEHDLKDISVSVTPKDGSKNNQLFVELDIALSKANNGETGNLNEQNPVPTSCSTAKHTSQIESCLEDDKKETRSDGKPVEPMFFSDLSNWLEFIEIETKEVLRDFQMKCDFLKQKDVQVVANQANLIDCSNALQRLNELHEVLMLAINENGTMLENLTKAVEDLEKTYPSSTFSSYSGNSQNVGTGELCCLVDNQIKQMEALQTGIDECKFNVQGKTDLQNVKKILDNHLQVLEFVDLQQSKLSDKLSENERIMNEIEKELHPNL